mgnify:CR=1 FL=1
MARPRIDVHRQLESAMTLAGYTPHVYYQPPDSKELTYPCIVYSRDKFNTVYANDHIYRDMTQYTVTVMDRDPESPLVDILRNIQYCEMDRELPVDNVHNFVFTYYYY